MAGHSSPPASWREHWFDHRQLLQLYSCDGHAAIYLDGDVGPASVRWLPPFISRTWQYSKAAYGDAFGPDPRIYSIHHGNRHGGGHPGYYYNAMHDRRNVSDCGPGPWLEGDWASIDYPSHEIGHVVESTNNGAFGSPAFGIWGDSKWAEFYQYDLYVALGMNREAQRLHRKFMGGADSFPRPGTRWFRDWFYPLWRDCGQAAVLARFFGLLAEHFPVADDGQYTRGLNWGEYIHFSSGAAAGDLGRLASRAFGWPAEWTGQLDQARAEFPLITY